MEYINTGMYFVVSLGLALFFIVTSAKVLVALAQLHSSRYKSTSTQHSVTSSGRPMKSSKRKALVQSATIMLGTVRKRNKKHC
jgi:hypothetical protein